jgi:Mrp family chromosome partitioning ATPase
MVVLSGKGGVGKSTVSVNLAVALVMAGLRVGLLDVDIHGPSIPTMLGLERYAIGGRDGELAPADVDGLKVISIGLFLPSPDDAIIWRGPLKMGAIKQFLKDVAWGDLDVLVIDSPPGTGEEPLSVCQLIGRLDGAVIVTTPQRVAAAVRAQQEEGADGPAAPPSARCRQADAEKAAAARGGIDHDLPPVLLDDLVGDEQPQAGSLTAFR